MCPTADGGLCALPATGASERHRTSCRHVRASTPSAGKRRPRAVVPDTQGGGTTASCLEFQLPGAQAPRLLFSLASPHCAQGRAGISRPAQATCHSLVTHRACVFLRGDVHYCAPYSRVGAPNTHGHHAPSWARHAGMKLHVPLRAVTQTTRELDLFRCEQAQRLAGEQDTSQRLPGPPPPDSPHPTLAPQAGFLPPLPTALYSAHTSEQIPTHSEEKDGLTCLPVDSA